MQAMIKRVLPGLCPRVKTAPMMALVMLITSAYLSPAMAAGSREEAATEAMGMHGQAGKVLSIREKNSDQGNGWYEVKILTDGNVSVYRIEKN